MMPSCSSSLSPPSPSPSPSPSLTEPHEPTPPHFLVITYPAQGHLNPALHFAHRLAVAGAQVTFTSTLFARRRLFDPSTVTHPLLSYRLFSDSYDDGFDFATQLEAYMSNFRLVGSRELSILLRQFSSEGRPVTCVVYTLLLSWAAIVARECGVPSTLLWIQPAAVFSIYHHYFHGSAAAIDAFIADPTKSSSATIEWHGLPPLAYEEIPSFLLPGDKFSCILDGIRELYEVLDKEEKPLVLVNTFDALESSAIRAIDVVKMAGVGPLIPKFLPEKERGSDSCGEWLELKPRGSVVYVSFGTVAELSERQMEEILNGLVATGRPFLWVVRGSDKDSAKGSDLQTRVRETSQGMSVPWCSQVEVLRHPSTGCFVTHCGWNSTTEGLAAGVPMVCCPQWSDQMMNAKLVEKVWKTGVRAKVDNGVLQSKELQRCLEEVMGVGERGAEIRKNATEWRDLATKAVGEGGSSYENLKEFILCGKKSS